MAMRLQQFLDARRDMLVNLIREKTTSLDEYRAQVEIWEKEVEQHKGALREILNMVRSVAPETTENDIEEDISDEATDISEVEENGDNT